MHAIDYFDDLPSYSSWSPTGFDSRGLNLPERQQWKVAPIGRNRDTEHEPLTASNWAVFMSALEEVDPDGEYHEAHSFGHWACGWFEIVLVSNSAPESIRVLVGETVSALADYPVLDEMDWSEREHEYISDIWQNCYSLSERIQLCADAGVSIFASRRDYPPHEVADQLLAELL